MLATATAALLLAGTALTGCTGGHQVADPGAEHGGLRDDLVSRSGAGFVAGGKPFRFIGFNFYDAASTPSYTCVRWPRLSDDQLDAAFAYLHDDAGATVIRFWAYQTYTEGGTSFAGVDRVLAAARRYDLKVLPVLEDGPGNCSTGTNGVPKTAYDGDTWYSAGYKVPYGDAKLSYRAYAARLTHHYRGNPTIFAWSMMNEAETGQRDAQGRSELVDFAEDIAAVIKAADPSHLLTVGTQSNGAPGASGPDFTAVYALPRVDFAEVHDYADRGSDTQALPGGPDNGTKLPPVGSAVCRSLTAPISCSMAEAAQQLHKPFIVGEAGIDASDDTTRTQRAALFHAKISAAFRAGASGYLIWQYNSVQDTGYDVLTTDHDPLFATTQKIATGLTG